MSNWNSDGLGHLRAGPLHEPIPRDEPEYLEGEDGELVECVNSTCRSWAETVYSELALCGHHARDERLWDQADNMNQIGWEE